MLYSGSRNCNDTKADGVFDRHRGRGCISSLNDSALISRTRRHLFHKHALGLSLLVNTEHKDGGSLVLCDGSMELLQGYFDDVTGLVPENVDPN